MLGDKSTECGLIPLPNFYRTHIPVVIFREIAISSTLVGKPFMNLPGIHLVAKILFLDIWDELFSSTMRQSIEMVHKILIKPPSVADISIAHPDTMIQYLSPRNIFAKKPTGIPFGMTPLPSPHKKVECIPPCLLCMAQNKSVDSFNQTHYPFLLLSLHQC